MSSWNEVLDEHLMQSGHIEGCMITGHDGHCWAKTGGKFGDLAMSTDESDSIPARLLSAVLNAFNDPSILLEYGFAFLDHHFVMTQYSDSVLFGKSGFTGLILVRTSQTLVFAVYNMNHQPSEAALSVEKFAHYLHSQEL